MTDGNQSAVSSILEPMGTDEYVPPPRTDAQRQAVHRATETVADASRRLSTSARTYAASRRGTAAGLLAMNEAAGDRYFEVPESAALDDEAAVATFSSGVPVIDVQTHWVEDKAILKPFQEFVLQSYRHLAPDWWSGLDGMVAYSIAEYLRCVFVEAQTALAVISCAPATEGGDMFITNEAMAGMRELFDRTAGTGRLLNHTVVRPNMGDLDKMATWADAYRPVGWKVYTMGITNAEMNGMVPGSGWRLDDDETGTPFLEECRNTGVRLVCAHKGVSGMVDAGSPSDVGPAALAFPDIDFVIYHSGYEPGMAEGSYRHDTAHLGVNRLVDSVQQAGLDHGSNVYAELGTTWFCLLSRPEDAAHTLGKLLLSLGEDNVVWGTDSIWYGPTQPVLDAFWSFQIPDRMCEEFGYPKLTPEIKRKVISSNAARVYGVDLDALQHAADNDDLSWTKDVFAHYGPSSEERG